MNTTKPAATKAVVKTADDNEVSFVPFGATDKIRLSMAMIRDFVAVRAKNGVPPSPRDCLKFLMLCKGKRANPFEGDCFMLGYNDGETAATYSIVCGIELFLKRAEDDENYKGNQAGVIVKTAEGISEREGAIVYDDEKLVGGWARVFRKNKDMPVYKTVKLSTYDTGMSRWKKDPGGMIAKVALSQALREAYPSALGGLYTQEEMQKVTEMGEGSLTIKEPIPLPEEIKKTEPLMSPEDKKKLQAELDLQAKKEAESPHQLGD
jgi:phage recombination protein Bet